MSKQKGANRYLGPFLDARIQQTQMEVKELTGKDISYKEAGERLASVKPIILPDITFQKGKRKKGVGMDLFRGMGLI